MTAAHPWSQPVPEKSVKRSNYRKSDGLAPGTKVWTWRDQDYFGASDLAAAVPCDVRTVYKHMRIHGNLDRLGSGSGAGKQNGHDQRTAVKIELDGNTHEWTSIRAMARGIGWTQASAQRCIKSTGRGRRKLELAIIEWHAKKRDTA